MDSATPQEHSRLKTKQPIHPRMDFQDWPPDSNNADRLDAADWNLDCIQWDR